MLRSSRREPPEQRSTSDPIRFRDIQGRYPTGVAVVSGVHEQEPVSIAGHSSTSVSLARPVVGFFAAEGSATYPKILYGGMFCVDVLPEDKARISGPFPAIGGAKRGGLGWQHAVCATPVLNCAAVWIDCRLESEKQEGDLYVAVREAVYLAVRNSPGPLIAYRGDGGDYGGYRVTDWDPGHGHYRGELPNGDCQVTQPPGSGVKRDSRRCPGASLTGR